MKLTRRKILLIVWVFCVLGSGLFIFKATDNGSLGIAASLSVLGVSLGVPLMRAFTEFSK